MGVGSISAPEIGRIVPIKPELQNSVPIPVFRGHRDTLHGQMRYGGGKKAVEMQAGPMTLGALPNKLSG